jgi:hypothetical protein
MILVQSTGNLLLNTTTDAGFRLDVNGTARVQGAITGTSTLTLGQTGNNGEVILNRTSTGTSVGGIRAIGSGTEIGGSGYLDKALFANGSGIDFFTWTGVASNTNQRMKIFATSGNVLIQNGGTFTDNGTRLRVVGTTQSDTITQNLASHGKKVLQYSTTASTTINLPTEFPLMTGLVVANAYAVFGKFLGKYLSYGQAIEFYISKNPNGTWNTVAYSDSSQFIASLISVTGSGNDLTITTSTDTSFILELTVMTQS